VDDQIANIVIAQLLFLESEDPDKTSCSTSTRQWHGTAGMAIYDTMQYVRPDVLPSAWAGRIHGSVPAGRGAKGKRYSLPHSRILIHQPLGGFSGQATDVDIHARRSCARATT